MLPASDGDQCFSATVTSNTSKRTRGAKQASRVMIVWFASHLHETRENWEHLRSLRLTHRLVATSGLKLLILWNTANLLVVLQFCALVHPILSLTSCCKSSINNSWKARSARSNLMERFWERVCLIEILGKPVHVILQYPSWLCSCTVLTDALAVSCAVHSLHVLTSVRTETIVRRFANLLTWKKVVKFGHVGSHDAGQV